MAQTKSRGIASRIRSLLVKSVQELEKETYPKTVKAMQPLLELRGQDGTISIISVTPHGNHCLFRLRCATADNWGVISIGSFVFPLIDWLGGNDLQQQQNGPVRLFVSTHVPFNGMTDYGFKSLQVTNSDAGKTMSWTVANMSAVHKITPSHEEQVRWLEQLRDFCRKQTLVRQWSTPNLPPLYFFIYEQVSAALADFGDALHERFAHTNYFVTVSSFEQGLTVSGHYSVPKGHRYILLEVGITEKEQRQFDIDGYYYWETDDNNTDEPSLPDFESISVQFEDRPQEDKRKDIDADIRLAKKIAGRVRDRLSENLDEIERLLREAGSEK